MRIIIYFLFIILVTFEIKAQKISSSDYIIETIFEDFSNYKSLYFDYQTNKENYITIDNGDLFMFRKNKQTSYIILAKHNPLKNFILKTELRIGPSKNKKSSIGIVLKTQNNRQGGIIFEINKSGEYKISHLNSGGKNKTSGWKKSSIINEVDKLNAIEVRSENNKYDIYINTKFLTTLKSNSNEEGINGIFINSDTKAKISYFNINTKKKNDNNTTIDKLNQKIDNLQKENTQLKTKIKNYSNKDKIKKSKKSITENKQIEEKKTPLASTKPLKNKANVPDSNLIIKNIMIQKEFESKGIRTSDLIIRTSKVQIKDTKAEKIFTVQIGVYTTEKEKGLVKDFWSIPSKLGTYIYYSGKFNTSNEAVLHLNDLVLKGYKNAFITTQNK